MRNSNKNQTATFIDRQDRTGLNAYRSKLISQLNMNKHKLPSGKIKMIKENA